MENFYCEIWDQKINEKQCYLKRDPRRYYKNPCCLECPKHENFILSNLGPKPQEISLPKIPPDKITPKDKPKPKSQKPKIQKPRRKPMNGIMGPHILTLFVSWSNAYLGLLKKSFYKLNSNERIAFERVKGGLMLLEASCWKNLFNAMMNGETWPVGIVIKAIGKKAFSNPWFIEGIKFLHNRGKTIQLNVPKSYDTKFKEFIRLGKSMERYRQKRIEIAGMPRAIRSRKRLSAESSFDEKSETIRTRYHRDFARAFEAIVLQFCELYVATPKEQIPPKVINLLPQLSDELKAGKIPFGNELEMFEGFDFDNHHIFDGLIFRSIK